MKTIVTAAVAALLLASCGGRDQAGNQAAGGEGGNAAAGGEAAVQGGAGGPAGATISLQPGQWETRVEVLRLDMANMPNMPAGMTTPLPPPTTIRSCLTPEQASQPNANFLTGSGEQGGCTYENFSMTGGRIQGTVTCNSQGTTARTTMNGRFAGDSYEMESESRVSANGATIDTASRVTSRRIGDCPAG